MPTLNFPIKCISNNLLICNCYVPDDRIINGQNKRFNFVDIN